MNNGHPPPELTEAPVILDRSRHPISRRDIDPDALKVLYRLHKKGHTAYLVGGAVRDLLLGRWPADFDVGTDAHPNRIKKIFANAFLIGRRFRLAHIRFQGGKIIEVSTFRKKPEDGPEEEDGTGGDSEDATATFGETEAGEPGRGIAEEREAEEAGKQAGAGGPPAAGGRVRKPIAFGTPREDAFRRDITINALFYDIATFAVIDYVGGLEDLAAKRIRIIGNPDASYVEDPVRIWRVLRHASRLGFSIEEKTEKAIARHGHLLSGCPGSRLFEELNKDMRSGTVLALFELMRGHGLLPLVLGTLGDFYARDDDRFSRLADRLRTIDAFSGGGEGLPSRILYALFFWPWAEAILSSAEGDKAKVLFEAQRGTNAAVLFPKGLLLDVFQTLVITDAMIQALKTRQMRWSQKKRAQYGDASLMCSLIVQGKPGEGPDPFEGMFRERFPSEAQRKRRRRPRRRPKGVTSTPKSDKV